MHGMCNYHIKFSAMLITEKTINLYQPLHACKLKVSFQTFTNNSIMNEEFPTACSLFALVPYVVVDIMVASLVQNFLIKIVILIHCVYANLYIVNFFYGSFLVMVLFRYDITIPKT